MYKRSAREEREIYKKSLDLFDGRCAICGNPNVAMHHIRYGSLRGGRQTYYGNVIPLCAFHHELVHTNKDLYMPKLIEIINNKMEDLWLTILEKVKKIIITL